MTSGRTRSSCRETGCCASTSSVYVSKAPCSSIRSRQHTVAGVVIRCDPRSRVTVRYIEPGTSGVPEGALAADADSEADALDVDGPVVAGAHRQGQGLEDVLADAAVLRELDGIAPREAGGAQLV